MPSHIPIPTAMADLKTSPACQQTMSNSAPNCARNRRSLAVKQPPWPDSLNVAFSVGAYLVFAISAQNASLVLCLQLCHQAPTRTRRHRWRTM